MVKANARRVAAPVRHKRPFSKRHLCKILEYCHRHPSLPNLRIAAMIMLCYTGCLRIKECIDLNLSDVKLRHNGGVRLKLKKAKTDRVRDGQYATLTHKGHSFRPAQVLQKYLRAARLNLGQEGAVFRKANGRRGKDGSFQYTQRITYTIATQELQDIIQTCNIETRYTWHSLRAGAASEALKQGASVNELKALGRWASEDGVAPYLKRGRKAKERVANLLAL